MTVIGQVRCSSHERMRAASVTRRWLAELLSLPLLFMVLPPYLIGYQMAHGQDHVSMFGGMVSLASLTIWGSVLNHYADWEADTINGKRMHLHRHCLRVSLARGHWIVLGAYVLAAVMSFGQSTVILLLLLLGLMGASQYSLGFRFKDRLWLSYPYLALAYGVYPLLLGLFIAGDMAKSDAWSALVITLLLLFLDAGIAPFKDYEDQEGDRRIGKRTLPNMHGVQTTVWFQTILIGLASIMAGLLVIILQVAWLWILVALCLTLLVLVHIRQWISDAQFDFLHYATVIGLAANMALLLITSEKPILFL